MWRTPKWETTHEQVRLLALRGSEAASDRPLHVTEIKNDLREHTGSPVAPSLSLVSVQLCITVTFLLPCA